MQCFSGCYLWDWLLPFLFVYVSHDLMFLYFSLECQNLMAIVSVLESKFQLNYFKGLHWKLLLNCHAGFLFLLSFPWKEFWKFDTETIFLMCKTFSHIIANCPILATALTRHMFPWFEFVFQILQSWQLLLFFWLATCLQFILRLLLVWFKILFM